jgi:hypothetical protein
LVSRDAEAERGRDAGEKTYPTAKMQLQNLPVATDNDE